MIDIVLAFCEGLLSMRIQKDEKGFTLVELLASIIILSIIIIGIFQLFVFSSKTVTLSQTKLVTTHLAKATIERVKVDSKSYIPFSKVTSEELVINKNTCNSLGLNCDVFTLKVNDLDYDIEIIANQSPDEKNLNLVNVIVTVSQPTENLSSTVEGYVVHE